MTSASTSPAAVPTRPVRRRALLAIVRFLLRRPLMVSACLGMLLINIGIELALPQLLGDTITRLGAGDAGRTTFRPGNVVAWFVALVTLRAGVGWVLGRVRNRTVQRTLGDIRAAVFDALQRLPFAFHDRSRSGELISRATTDTWRLQDFLFACLLFTVDIGVTLVLTVYLVFRLSPALGWVAVGTMVPTMTLIAFFARRLQPRWRRVHDLHSEMTTVVQENIAGVRVVKAFAREADEVAKFRQRRDAFLEDLGRTVGYWAARVPVAQFIFGLGTPLALWVGGNQVLTGQLPLGDLAKVVFYLMTIGHRIGQIGQFTNIIQNAAASAERIVEVLDEPRSVADGGSELPDGPGRVEFDDVSFAYPAPLPVGSSSAGDRHSPAAPAPREPVTALQGITFRAPPGQTIAVVGPTGSGKSSLVSLIPRFHDPAAGTVRLDGISVRQLRLAELRRAVGTVFQDTFLFTASVAENIAFGCPTVDREAIRAAARVARADGFISELPEGYETIIGERGVSLSGGQRQRIAIARAVLMQPRVLILDDATASIDASTEREIQSALREVSAGRTTFIIAQRVATVRHADLILVLDRGRIVDHGRHEELLSRSGFYREICEHQLRP